MLLAFIGFAATGSPQVALYSGAAGVGLGMLPLPQPKQAFFAPVVLTELFTGELIKKFRFVGKWLSRIPFENKYVNNNVIHLVDVGADPDVLINNTAYPIATNARNDEDIAVALVKYDTTNTKITDDELYALSYDKIGSVVEQHGEVLEEVTAQRALHALCPSQDSANTPIVLTTGANTGNRKKLTIADVATLKKRLDDLKVPMDPGSRILVLCNEHVQDLLTDTDQNFKDRFYNTKTGEPIDFYGFEVFQDVFPIVFNSSTGVKKAWGAAGAGTDRNASTLILRQRAFQARGTVKMYYRLAENDPENRETRAGFRLYHVALPKKTTGFGAILSAPSS